MPIQHLGVVQLAVVIFIADDLKMTQAAGTSALQLYTFLVCDLKHECSSLVHLLHNRLCSRLHAVPALLHCPEWGTHTCLQDTPRNMRFSINFFTSIGLGGLTDNMREHLKNIPRLIAQPAAGSDSDASSSSSSGVCPVLNVHEPLLHNG